MFKKHHETKQKFSIKKFKFGAASVLIGTVFAVFAGGVQAEEIAASTDSSASVATTVVPESTSETAVAETTVATPEVVVAESAAPASSETVEVPASTEASTTAESTVASSETAASTEEKATETRATETAKPATESSASTNASQAVAVERVAAAPYKVTYTDVANNEVVYSTNHSVVEKTTAPATERATFNVTATSQVGTTAALEGYKLAEGQAAVQAGIVTERGGRNNIINFNVVKDDVAAAAGPDNEEGYTGFRATVTNPDGTTYEVQDTQTFFDNRRFSNKDGVIYALATDGGIVEVDMTTKTETLVSSGLNQASKDGRTLQDLVNDVLAKYKEVNGVDIVRGNFNNFGIADDGMAAYAVLPMGPGSYSANTNLTYEAGKGVPLAIMKVEPVTNPLTGQTEAQWSIASDFTQWDDANNPNAKNNSFTMGAVDPTTGIFYFGTAEDTYNKNFSEVLPATAEEATVRKAERDSYIRLWAYDPNPATNPTGAIRNAGYIKTGIAQYNGTDANVALNGDFTFDADGNLSIIMSPMMGPLGGVNGKRFEYTVSAEKITYAGRYGSKYYKIDGQLSEPFDAPNLPNGTAVDSNGRIYYSNGARQIGILDRNTDGTVTSQGVAFTGTLSAQWGDLAAISYRATGTVEVTYVDVDTGETIKAKQLDPGSAKRGTEYDTREEAIKPGVITTDDGRTYILVPDATVGAETGRMPSGLTTVTYKYKEVKGDVVVNYIDEAGNTLTGTGTLASGTTMTVPTKNTENYQVLDTPLSKVGTEYNTTDDNKPQTIITETGKTFTLIAVAPSGDPETGKVKVDYTLIKEPVYATDEAGNYALDADGNKIVKTANVDGREVPLETVTGVEVTKTRQTITYVYHEEKGRVVVNYVDTDGNVIATQATDTPESSTGVAYETFDYKKETIVTADGKTYRLVPAGTEYAVGEVAEGGRLAESGSERGTVKVGETAITYVYQEVTGDVVVNYVTADGTVIKPQAVDTAKGTSTGVEYNTTDNEMKPTEIVTEDGKTYRYNHTDGNETGKVVAGTTEVTYVYDEVKGDVLVHYVDTTGKTIKGSVVNTASASTGTSYDTTDESTKPAEIVTEDGKVYRLVPAATQGSETGKVKVGTTDVTYVYEEVKGNVVVNYKDTAGNEIQPSVEDTPTSSVGTTYETADRKPAIITTADDKTYRLVPALTEGEEAGKVVEGTTEVTYIYEEVKGNVVVNYTTADGTVIKSPVTDEANASTGTDYSTTDNKPEVIVTEAGKTYKLVPTATKGKEAGEVVAGTTEVTYIYEEVKGSVVVNYTTADGTVIKAPVTDVVDSSTGVDYSTTDNKPETITTADGKVYRLVPKATKGNETGKVVAGTTQVTYVYEEVKGNVVVNYKDTEGNEIAPSVNDETDASVGTTYTTTDEGDKPTEIVTKEGKTYKLLPAITQGSEKGKVVEGTTEVTYIYEEVKGNVVVNYTTADGTVLQAPVTDEANVSTGTSYDTTDNKPTTIITNGKVYRLVATQGSETGQVTKGTTQVTYVYEEVKGSVVVNYVDEAGNVIKSPVTDTEGATPGSPYETADQKLDTITTEDGKTYRLKAVPTNASGNVTEGTTQVTYIYEEVKGKVVVNYVDEQGNVLQAPVTDVAAASTGTDYSTTDNKPSVLVVNGKTYELVRLTGSETGKVVEGTTEVTYVYREVVKSSTFYVTEDGETLSPSRDGKQPSESIPGYELIKSIPDENGNVVHTYRKLSTVNTTFVDEEGNTLSPQEDGTQSSKDIKGYELVSSKVDEKGNTIHVYRPVTSVVTRYVDEEGNVLADQESGARSSKEIAKYSLVSTTIDEKGNVTHVYRKVTQPMTSFVDENGKELLPPTEGTVSPKEIPGYKVITTTDKDGNTTHVYRKVKTSFVDENGKELLTSEEGTVSPKAIPGYTVITTKDENGDTVHVYRKVVTPVTPEVVKPVTSFVDETGKELAPSEEGTLAPKVIDGYELVTTKDEKGNTVHVYRKVVTPAEPTQPAKPVQPAAPATKSEEACVAAPASAEAKPATKTENKLEVLPNTGTENTATASALGVGMILTALGLAGKRRRKED